MSTSKRRQQPVRSESARNRSTVREDAQPHWLSTSSRTNATCRLARTARDRRGGRRRGRGGRRRGIIERIGYDAVRMSPLSAGPRLHPGGRGPSALRCAELSSLALTPRPLGVAFQRVFGRTPSATSLNDATTALSHPDVRTVEQGGPREQVGRDFFGIGEHHTGDCPLSPATSWLRRDPATTKSRGKRSHPPPPPPPPPGSHVDRPSLASSTYPPRVPTLLHTQRTLPGPGEVILGRAPA